MSDVKCPICGFEQEINHDDGYGFEEDERHDQFCINCEYEFEFTTSITYSYNVYCKDDDHNLEPFGDKWPDMYECTKCDYFEYKKPAN